MKDDTKKFEVVFEDDDCISIWKYDHTKTKTGPVETEIKWKKGKEPKPEKKKTLGELAKETRKQKKTGS